MGVGVNRPRRTGMERKIWDGRLGVWKEFTPLGGFTNIARNSQMQCLFLWSMGKGILWFFTHSYIITVFSLKLDKIVFLFRIPSVRWSIFLIHFLKETSTLVREGESSYCLLPIAVFRWALLRICQKEEEENSTAILFSSVRLCCCCCEKNWRKSHQSWNGFLLFFSHFGTGFASQVFFFL